MKVAMKKETVCWMVQMLIIRTTKIGVMGDRYKKWAVQEVKVDKKKRR